MLMLRVGLFGFALFLFTQPLRLFAQSSSPADSVLSLEKKIFIRNIKHISNDSSGSLSIAGYFETEQGRIRSFLQDGIKLKARDREKAERSVIYFISELNRHLEQGKISIYDIPDAVRSYQLVLKAILLNKPLLPVLAPLSSGTSQIIAAAFTQYPNHAYMEDIAVYKRVVASPEFILQFLENRSGFRFADSLLIAAATHDPYKLVSYLKVSGAVQDRIRNSRNVYLRQLVSLSEDKQASELLPFITQIEGKRFTPAEILEIRMEPVKYFQLLVNTLQESIATGHPGPAFLHTLRNSIKQKSLAFYTNEINALHDAPGATRFASVKGLRPQDIYYIITSGGEELYTSSYLGLYKRLLDQFQGGALDSLFDLVQHDNFRVFMRLAANYNVLNDFLHKLSPEKMNIVLKEFISGIEKDENTGLERAMDIADSFSSLDSADDIGEVIQSELRYNLDLSRSKQQFLGIRLYSILTDVFKLAQEKDSKSSLWETLGDYEVLKRSSLQNEKGEISEVVLFYGDEDGVASFSNFLRLFTNKSKWEISRNEYWISIRSLTENPVIIYANLPLDISEQLDLRAQDSLYAFLAQQSVEPAIIVHRGHSYHLSKTLKRLKPSMKLAILGSCGSYNKAISIANINPDVHVIGSKKMGSKSINDPILDVINNTLVDANDLVWPEIWKQLSDRFSKDQAALSLFSEYFPPSHNLSLYVLKLFISNVRERPGVFAMKD